jgi:hypothetical protein
MAMRAPFPPLAEVTHLPVDKLAVHILWYLTDIAPKYEQIHQLAGRCGDTAHEGVRLSVM